MAKVCYNTLIISVISLLSPVRLSKISATQHLNASISEVLKTSVADTSDVAASCKRNVEITKIAKVFMEFYIFVEILQ